MTTSYRTLYRFEIDIGYARILKMILSQFSFGLFRAMFTMKKRICGFAKKFVCCAGRGKC